MGFNPGLWITVTTRDLQFITLLNPDGYNHTRNGETWSGNGRRIVVEDTTQQYGVSIDRNFGAFWDDNTSSGAPSDPDYRGPFPFSEPESRAIRELIELNNISMVVNLKSNGGRIVQPWNYKQEPHDNETLDRMAEGVGKRLGISVANLTDDELHGGSLIDWVYNNHSLPALEIGVDFLSEGDEFLPVVINQTARSLYNALLYLMDIAPDPSRAILPEWTVLAYLNGDNNLAEYLQTDLDEMASVDLDPSVNVIALVDRDGNNDTRLQHLENKTWINLNLSLVNLSWNDELDLSDHTILEQFGSWGVKTYPARKYFVLVWGHGRGLKGFLYDGQSFMTVLDFAQALSTISSTAGKPIDLLGADACTMALAGIGYQLRNNVKIMVASEKEVPVAGWPYDDILGELAARPHLGSHHYFDVVA